MILKNCLIIDGQKNSQIKKGTIVIEDEKIKDVIFNSDNINFEDEIIDLDGLYVCPGFIDVHSHSDLTILVHPEAESAISQGVTTIISGNCGFSVAPVHKTIDNLLTESKSYGIDNIPWSSVSQYLDYLEKNQISVNYSYLLGHGQVRAEVVGYSNKNLDSDLFRKMKYEVEKALDEGCIGLSLGLIYIPGRFASFEELVELAKIVSKKGKIVTNHMRSESSALIEAIQESIDISRIAEVNFQISHLKAAGVGKGKARLACEIISKAIESGVNVTADQYPYNASNTGLSQVLPPQYLEGSIEEIIQKISVDPEKVARDIESYPHTPWDKILISEAYNPKLTKYLGMSIKQIADDMKIPEALAVIELMKIENYDLGAIYFIMDQDEVDFIATRDFVMVASDSAIRNCDSLSFPHPRTFGSFTKFISYYVKEKSMLSLNEAIYKMTYFPALKFNLTNRGLIKKGYFADLVVFDLDRVKDLASYSEPKKLSEGIKYVFVNGKVAYHNGKVLNKNGKILRK